MCAARSGAISVEGFTGIRIRDRAFVDADAHLLVAQRLNRIQIRRLPSRIDPKDQPNRAGDKECRKHPHRRQQRRKEEVHRQNYKTADRDPKQTSHRTERHRLQRELVEDRALGRTDGLAYPDLPRSFRNRNEHDVHHAHATYHQAHAGQREHQDEETTGELRPKLVNASEPNMAKLSSWSDFTLRRARRTSRTSSSTAGRFLGSSYFRLNQ